MPSYAYIGCRTSQRRGARGRGIKVFRIDAPGVWHLVQTLASSQENPSWLTLNAAATRLYAIHGDGDRISVYQRNSQSGELRWLSDQTTGPANRHPDLDPLRRNNPVHAVLTPDEKYVLIANHEAGNIACLAVENADALSPPLAFTPIAGRPAAVGAAKNLSRPHEIIFAPDQQHFAVPVQGRDAGMGLDMLQIYRFQQGEVIKTDEVRLADGSWPRHVDFHPSGRWLYCLTELGNTLCVFDYDASRGSLSLKQTLSSLPDGWEERSDASEVEVHRSGRFLYAANRGHDSIGIFSIDQQHGTLTATEWVNCGGKTPRFTAFSPEGTCFYSANEDADTLCEFHVDAGSGMLTASGMIIPAESPTCICFV
ncbi:lactonase family protein [Kosakonia sp. BK9b]